MLKKSEHKEGNEYGSDDKSREQIIIERLTEKLINKINSKEIKKIIDPIISISKDLQRRKK